MHFPIFAANNAVFIVDRANGVADRPTGLMHKCWDTTLVPPCVMLRCAVLGRTTLSCCVQDTPHHTTARHISNGIRSTFRSFRLVAVRTEDWTISRVESQLECAFVEVIWKCVYQFVFRNNTVAGAGRSWVWFPAEKEICLINVYYNNTNICTNK